jgi:hypothetical protein
MCRDRMILVASFRYVCACLRKYGSCGQEGVDAYKGLPSWILDSLDSHNK